MEFFETVKKRRSVRQFKSELFPDELVKTALEAAVLAPNSSNTQTWDFHWIKNSELRAQVVNACMNQAAARTSTQLVVVTANPEHWRRSQKPLVIWVTRVSAPKQVIQYYEKMIPYTYRSGFLNIMAPFKFLITLAIGLFRPMMRGPLTLGGIQEVAIKSAALACENFVLAITAQGGATCMMEGFDEWRLKRALRLRRSARVVMVLGIGYESERGTWGPQFRLPLEEVVHVYD